MRISADFLGHGPNVAREEAATVARIRIIIGNRCATDMRAPGEREFVDHLIAPAYPLAEALAHRWWTLAYARGRTSRLRSMRAGFALPDVSIMAVGNGSIDVQCEPFVYENPPLEFVTKADESVSVQTFQNDLHMFLESVTEQLHNKEIGETPLFARWSQVKTSLTDPEEREFCKAAGALGVDPYTCGDSIAALIDLASSLFENDDLEEFLAGAGPTNGTAAINWVKQAERQPDDWSILPAIEDCRTELAFRRRAHPPWTTGYASARRMRQHLGLDDTQPVGDLQALASRLGNPRFHATEQSRAGIRGVSRTEQGKSRAIVSGSRNPATLLFAVARTFGDAIHFGGQHRSPVTDQVGTYRQQLGRAFAAQFLAPVHPVLEMARGEPIDEIAANFGVSEMVIQHQIENAPNSLAALAAI